MKKPRIVHSILSKGRNHQKFQKIEHNRKFMSSSEIKESAQSFLRDQNMINASNGTLKPTAFA